MTSNTIALDVIVNGEKVARCSPPEDGKFDAVISNRPGGFLQAYFKSKNDSERQYWRLPDLKAGDTIAFVIVADEQGDQPNVTHKIEPTFNEFWNSLVNKASSGDGGLDENLLGGTEKLFFQLNSICGDIEGSGIAEYFRYRYDNFASDIQALQANGFDAIANDLLKCKSIMFGTAELSEDLAEDLANSLGIDESPELEAIDTKIDELYLPLCEKIEKLHDFVFNFGLQQSFYYDESRAPDDMEIMEAQEKLNFYFCPDLIDFLKHAYRPQNDYYPLSIVGSEGRGISMHTIASYMWDCCSLPKEYVPFVTYIPDTEEEQGSYCINTRGEIIFYLNDANKVSRQWKTLDESGVLDRLLS